MKYLYSFFSVFCILFSCNDNKSNISIKPINNSTIDSLILTTFNRGLFNGSILVVKNDSIIYKNSFGFTDGSKTKELKPNMVFNIGSISKELSAASIMKLVEENKINLDDKISKFNLGLPSSWAEKVKVSHLLNYSSGLPKYNWDRVRTNDDVYTDLKNIKELEFEPGTNFFYSNNNVFIRKLIIEHISRLSFNEYVKKHILIPLKMENTFLSPVKETSQFATGFNNEGINYKEIYQMDGGTYTTPEDLYKWIQGLYAEKIISTESIQILATPLKHKNANQSSLGFTNVKNGIINRHQASGSNVDYESIVDYNLENGLTTILLTNNKNYKLWELNRAINAILNNQSFNIPNKQN
ncbi:serine hydrolase domain-containing protein [uncultured Dokdonia sp.]|uniref:serine hydrolase domain-containing protein n=1 Tax=uncultured Dokdonia sp. TaxID=575653 RepID=UPI0026339B2D|nr:serine hydrolase domain-containing protein [uncultured Dokdonia sp.]